jgi:large subunit ribosomal protein L35
MKLKTRHSAAKRVKIKKKCFARKSVNTAHFMSKKSSQRVRRLSLLTKIHSADLHSFKLMLPY